MKKIQEFARLVNTTTKTLRFYDNTGILKADHVDPENGYRYYKDEQTEKYERISELKEIGFTLDEIKFILDEKDRDKLVSILKSKGTELLSAYGKCMALIEKYQGEKVKSENGISLTREEDYTRITLSSEDATRTFVCKKDRADVCHDILEGLFFSQGMDNLKVSDIPEEYDDVIMFLQIESDIDKLLSSDVNEIMEGIERIDEVKHAMIHLSALGQADFMEITDIMYKICDCFSKKIPVIWGVDLGPHDTRDCKLEIMGLC